MKGYQFDADAFRTFRVPTLLVLGGDSVPLHHTAAAALRSALSNSTVVVLEGQQHDAIDTDTTRFGQEVLKFLIG